MSTLVDAVVGHLELLHTQRKLIAQMYVSGHVVRDEQNAKALSQLQQIRAVRLNETLKDSYRLSPTVSRLLNEASYRSRNYGVSADFGKQLSRLDKLLEDFSEAYFDGRGEDVMLLQDEIDLTLFEISEEMKDFLLHVRTAAENNFGNVRTYREKEKQNLHYLEQLERIVEALSQFDDAALLESLGSSEREALEALYQGYILDRLSSWRSTTADITRVLKLYLHKLRVVEPRARRLRALQMYLLRHPEYEVRDPDEYPEIPDWAYQYEPIKLRFDLDFGRQDIRESLADVAKNIDRSVAVPTKERRPGTPVTEAPPKAALIKGSPLVVVSQRLLNEAAHSAAPMSAARYFALAPETQVLDQESCMMCFLALLDKQVKANAQIVRRLQIELVSINDDDRLSGNVIIADVTVCKR
ncbi:hypothetical protein AAIM60_13350 [Pseudomonas lijiangensis]|uniref:hypothetical protein n=1 Tax=Pseudomonas lijiangensis TaxID=2995658 RepID=UPI0031BA0B19